MIYYIEYTPERWKEIESNLKDYIKDVQGYNWIQFNLIYYQPPTSVTGGYISNCNSNCLSGIRATKCRNICDFIKVVKKELNIKEMEKEFTLNDLKPGMVVKYRNSNKRLVVSINGKLHFISDTDYLGDVLDNYNNDLTCISDNNFDIMKVYEVLSIGGLNYLLSSSYKELIWERKEPKVYTMQEIADKLGIPVEQLRIKK